MTDNEKKVEDLNKYRANFKKKKELFEAEGKGEEFIKKQIYLKNALTVQQTINQQDIDLGNKYRSIVLDEKRASPDGRIYFKGHHVEKIGIPFDIVFVYGGKNIGKTVATSEHITNILRDPKRKVMLLRNTRLELNTGFSAQLDEENGPFYYVKSGSKLLRKKDYIPERGPGVKRDKGGRPKSKKNEDGEMEKIKDEDDVNLCGGATCLTGMGLRSFQGAQYPGLTDVFWDECNDVGDITVSDLKAFLIFVLSLERKKKKFNIGLMGNLLRHESGMTSNIFLDTFGIPYDCKLKYFVTEKGLRFLYINPGQAGDLFNGTDEQKFTELIGHSAAEDLLSNIPQAHSVKVLDRTTFLTLGQPLGSFIVIFEQEYFIVYIAALDDRPEGYKYILRIENFVTAYHHHGYHPITDSVVAANQFGNLTYKKRRHVGKIVKKLFKLQKKRLLYFADDESRTVFSKRIYEKLLSKYSEEIGDIL